MKKILRCKNEKSDNFWKIETLDKELSVNYGKWGIMGKTYIKKFDNARKCEKEAEKLVRAKMKSGYSETNKFDEISHTYLDTEDDGLHILTSHPLFRQYFTDDIYYNAKDEFAPFGCEAGKRVMQTFGASIKKYHDSVDYHYFAIQSLNPNIWDRYTHWGIFHLLPTSLSTWEKDLHDEFPWNRFYLPPMPGQSDEELKEILLNQYGSSSGEKLLVWCDRVIIASALGMIKISGNKTKKALIDLAMMSLNRLEQTERVLQNDNNDGICKYTSIIRRDLQEYVKNSENLPITSMEDTYKAVPKISQNSDGNFVGVIPLVEMIDTVIPIYPEQIIYVDRRSIRDWKIAFVGLSDNKIIGEISYRAVEKFLAPYIAEETNTFFKIKGMSMNEIQSVLKQFEENKDSFTEINDTFEKEEDTLSAKTVRKIFDGEYTLHTLGNVKFPTGCVVAADPICCMQNSQNVTFSKKNIPVGEYPLEIAVFGAGHAGQRLIMGARLKIKEGRTVLYKPLEVYREENGIKEDAVSGFPVEAGLATICDRSAAEAYWRFLDKWYAENPQGNIYDDYFAEIFAESYRKFPDLQKEQGEFIMWTVPETEWNIPMFATGFGDGFYLCRCGYDRNGDMTELIEIFIHPDIK